MAERHRRCFKTPDPGGKPILMVYRDLGTAIERAGNPTAAPGRIAEVYGQNIGDSGVRQKICLLRQSARGAD
ncbi:MAG: hypothetical protein P8Z30_14850 [Acidobacteriota bacterium]